MDEFCPIAAWGAPSCSLARLPPAPACSVCCCPCRAAPGPGSHRCPCRAHTRSRSQPSPRYTGATQRVGVSGLGWLPTPHPLQALFSPTSFWARAHLPFPCKPPYQSLNMVTSPTPFPRHPPPFLPSPRPSSPSRTLHRCVQRDSARGHGRGCGSGCGRSGLGSSPGSGCPRSPSDRDHT